MDTSRRGNSDAQWQDSGQKDGLFDRYGAYIILGGLILYVILLGIGTFAEIFKIKSILDWWIWSPPGR